MNRLLIANPPPWPDGARCAVAFTFDMDAESLAQVYWPNRAVTHVAAASMLRYGPEVGVPRLVKMFAHFDIRQTFFIPGWCVERYPDTLALLADKGHEVGHHGYLHERNFHLSVEDERKVIRAGSDAIFNAVGKKPRGFRAPSYAFSENTLRLLTEDDAFAYDSSLFGDDVPYIIADRRTGKQLLELPVDMSLDDWPQYVSYSEFGLNQPIRAPDRAMEVFRAEFDAAWNYGGMWISVWHPFVSGRTARCDAIWTLIEYMRDKGGVWFATLGEITDHIATAVEQGLWKPRSATIPFNEGPVVQIAMQDPNLARG